MTEKVVVGIKKAEGKAQKIVEKAMLEKEELIKKAGQEAADFEAKEIEKFRKQLDERMQEHAKKVAAKAAKTLSSCDEELEELAKSRQKVKKAVDHVSVEFESGLKKGF